MPGIAGIIGPALSDDGAPRVAAMTETMRHESFYRSGTHLEPTLAAGFGWVAHEDAFAQQLPIWNESHDIALIFSGEDFPPTRNGAAAESAGAYLVRAYEKAGRDFLVQLNGWFSGVVVDLRAQRIVLFNDRYGVNRVFFHEHAGTFYFASEAKALLQILPGAREIDPQGFGEFLSLGCVLQHRTLFRGVQALPPASVWTFERGRAPTRSTYFDPATWESQPILPRAEWQTRLQETWARILPRYIQGEQALALSLTGGVDSRLILAWLDDPALALSCYTFGGRIRECADVRLARRLATMAGRTHEVIPITDGFFTDFTALAERTVYLSDAGMDVSGAVDLHVQKVARTIAPVRLNGVYGGEILRRLVVFKPGAPRAGLFAPELAAAATAAAQTYDREKQCPALTFTAFKQAPWAMTGKFAVERSQVTLRSPYFDNELVALAYQGPDAACADNQASLALIASGNARLAAVPTDRGLVQDANFGFTRLRHLFNEFTFKAEYAYDYGMPQWLARADHAVSPLHLERLFLGRHKFHHFRLWYRDALAPHLRAILLDPRTLQRSIYNRRELERVVQAHTRGTGNHTTEIHKLLTIELAMRQFIDGPAAPRAA